eukprot:47438-Eustigmatos_ZCMA.PRE.1
MVSCAVSGNMQSGVLELVIELTQIVVVQTQCTITCYVSPLRGRPKESVSTDGKALAGQK